MRDGRPVRLYRLQRFHQWSEITAGVHGPSAGNGQFALDMRDVAIIHLEVGSIQYGQVGELSRLDAPLKYLLLTEPGRPHRVMKQGLFAAQPLVAAVQRRAADTATGGGPVQRIPGVVAGDPCRVGTQAQRQAGVEHIGGALRVTDFP